MKLYQIVAPGFSAGLELTDGIVYSVPPVVSYMLGWPLDKVKRYAKMRGWRLNDVRHTRPGHEKNPT
jgi:hypothetical protein